MSLRGTFVTKQSIHECFKYSRLPHSLRSFVPKGISFGHNDKMDVLHTYCTAPSFLFEEI
jgi:hypothetical protein